ncbi:MAG: DUF4097 domain-containing protein [Clostridiales bacterium]|nr:DUF4097 domain-containing protein [Clostridiales bacterium]
MNTTQRVIKYVAIGFAVLLTVVIISGAASLISIIVSPINSRSKEIIDYEQVFLDKIENLEINSRYSKLIVRPGGQFKVEASNVSDDFKVESRYGTLIVEESNFINRFFNFNFGKFSNREATITVYVPNDFMANRIDIDSGVGNVLLEDLSTDKLIINAGVGDIRGTNITAKEVEANGGVGNIDFTSVNFSDIEFNSGVGDVKLAGIISGKSEFECGIGDVEIDIKGSREDYALDIDSGMGRIRVNGNKISSNYIDNFKSDNTIRIDGGIGNVDIDFND